MDLKKNYIDLYEKYEQLQTQLDEANDTIRAIRGGEIDALIVKGADGHQLYTLKNSDHTYRVFIEKMNEGAVTLNAEGLILYCNSSLAEILNIPLSKMAGSVFLNLVPASGRVAFQHVIHTAWQQESKGEVMLLKKDGTLNPFLYSLTTLELEEGIALSIILTDLSLQKETELQLKQRNNELAAAKQLTEQLNDVLEYKVQARTKELLLSKEHSKFLADNLPVIAWTALPDGTVIYYNKRWYEYSGMTDATHLEEQWLSRVHPDDIDLTVKDWKNSLATGEPFHLEHRLLQASDEAYRWHYSNAIVYKDENGEAIAWFGISTDIDEQKKNLERKDEFISTVSHELKTPVTSLKGFTQLLMAIVNKDKNPLWANYLTTMDNQINKLTRLITDLLDATRFNGGQLQFTTEVFDFNTLVTEIGKELQLTTDKHIIKIKLDSSAKVSGDRNRIGQVITNLVSNAIKYSPGADHILITSKHKDHSIECCVKDFGIGISKQQQPHLYTRFFRATEADANTFPGMGLGLFISMGIIEKHHGSMWVKSEPGKGSEFYFTINTVEELAPVQAF